jgi:hypothetical protein
MKKKKEKMDAVKMMRDIRDRLSERYYNNADALHKDMESIRKKYKLVSKTTKTSKAA